MSDEAPKPPELWNLECSVPAIGESELERFGPVRQWPLKVDQMKQQLTSQLAAQGLKPSHAPEYVGGEGALCEIQEPFRVIRTFALYSVIGWNDEENEPIYGGPEWRMRVSTFAEAQ